jgi:cell wall-associated NlpC family hydrolase
MHDHRCPHAHRPGGTGGVGVLVAVTVLALLVAPHAKALRDSVPAGLPALRLPRLDRTPPAPATASPRAARAVAFALAQQGKPYRWGAEGPGAYDCSGLTRAAWRAAGVAIPRTAAAQLAQLPRVRGRLRPGDLVVYRSDGPTRRHVAMVVSHGRLVEALGRGVPVRVTGLRGRWLGAVRPGGAR